LPSSGEGERLTRVASNDEIHCATPRSPVESFEISPDGSRRKESIRHAGEQDVLRELLDLDVADRPVAGDGSLEAEALGSDAGTDGEGIDMIDVTILLAVGASCSIGMSLG